MPVHAVKISAFQEAEIECIKAAQPGFALVLDGRDELRFKNTHPLMDRFIQDHFERISDTPDSAYQIYRAKNDRSSE